MKRKTPHPREGKKRREETEARLAKLPVTAQRANNAKDVDFAFG